MADPRRRRERVKVTSWSWLVRSAASFWGEFLFVEVRTDEGITGWGEITSTTKTANRDRRRGVRELERPARRSGPGRGSR